MPLLQERISELESMKKYPSQLFYEGDLSLLQRRKISIVGSRKPTKYSRETIQKLASSLAKNGVCIVSGGAMGIDATAHAGAKSSNTIAVLPCGIDIRYPAVNKHLLGSIENEGLLLSQFESGFRAAPWSFVVRNEVVVALGEVLIVGEADKKSGTMQSVAYALQMGKKIFVLPQRLGESGGTNELLREGKAEVIYDIDEFAASFGSTQENSLSREDPFLQFCKKTPSYEEAAAKYPQRVFEAELTGEIEIKNGRIFVL